MKILMSVPSGYHARELFLPLSPILDDDTGTKEVHVVTPGKEPCQAALAGRKDKFFFYGNKSGIPEYKTLFNEIKPDIVITNTIGLDVLDIPILGAAKELGIKTLTFIASWDNVFKIERLIRKGHSGADKRAPGGYYVPDFVAVWNQQMSDHLQRIFPELSGQVFITGPPRFDYFHQPKRIPTREEILGYLGFEENSFKNDLIHLATTELYPFAYVAWAIKEAIDKKEINRPLNIYASVHPGGNINNHEAIADLGAIVKYSFGRRDASSNQNFQYMPTEKEIYLLVALFKQTSVLVNQSSTVAIESMCANVPIINVKYGRKHDWWRWRRSMVYRDFKEHYREITDGGATTIVKNEKELVNGINTYLANPGLHQVERQQTLQRLITFTDGTCGEKFVGLVNKLVRE